MVQQLLDWIEARIPMMNTWNKHIAQYPAPKNFNFWYFLARWRCWCWLISWSQGSG